MYITAAVGSVQGNVGRLASAGHPAPLLLKGGEGGARPLSSGGFVLGAFDHATCPEAPPFDLAPGDGLLLFTDGALPRVWDGEAWRGSVETAWKEHRGGGPSAVLDAVWGKAEALMAPGERDDVTLVLLVPGGCESHDPSSAMHP